MQSDKGRGSPVNRASVDAVRVARSRAHWRFPSRERYIRGIFSTVTPRPPGHYKVEKALSALTLSSDSQVIEQGVCFLFSLKLKSIKNRSYTGPVPLPIPLHYT